MSSEIMNIDTASLRVESRNGLYVARLLPGRMEGWGVGSIGEPASSPEAEAEFIQDVIDSIVPVSNTERAYSDCTDGRFRLLLNDGSPVPVREKLVGADTIMAFHMAEALGAKFYENPKAPLAERLDAVVDFLLRGGYMPSAHYACGAGAGYPTIVENAARFSAVPAYVERQKLLLPVHTYDDRLHAQTVTGYHQRLDSGAYQDWSADLIINAVEKKVGSHGLIRLQEDSRGVHGHVEGLIARLYTPGAALDVNGLAERSGGRQAFSSNDNRMQALAELFGRGHDDDYRVALMAGEDFTDAGHGTLATNLSTIAIEQRAA